MKVNYVADAFELIGAMVRQPKLNGEQIPFDKELSELYFSQDIYNLPTAVQDPVAFKIFGETFSLRPGLYSIFAPGGMFKTTMLKHIYDNAVLNASEKLLINVGEPTVDSRSFSPRLIARDIRDEDLRLVCIDSFKNLSYTNARFGTTSKGVPNDIFAVAGYLDRAAKHDGIVVFAVFNTLSGAAPDARMNADSEYFNSLPSVIGLNSESSGIIVYDSNQSRFLLKFRGIQGRKTREFMFDQVKSLLGLGESVDESESLYNVLVGDNIPEFVSSRSESGYSHATETAISYNSTYRSEE